MLTLNLTIVGDSIGESDTSFINYILRERFRHIDWGDMRYPPVANYLASITCKIYLPVEFWENFFSQLRQIRSHFEKELDKQIWQIIISLSERDNYRNEPYYPSGILLQNYQGIWIDHNILYMGENITPFLGVANTLQLEDWFLFPFDADETDGDYELCTPGDLREIGNRINGSVRRISAPIGVRVRLAKGYKLSDYISAAFNQTLQSISANQDLESALGGGNVILTTILQMNDKLSLVNHYSEELADNEDINLYSLSAMNMSLVDERDETNIAVLVSSGQLIIEDIKLGHGTGV